jgi:predicted transcriptional regulator
LLITISLAMKSPSGRALPSRPRFQDDADNRVHLRPFTGVSGNSPPLMPGVLTLSPDATHLRYTFLMKTATIPSIRVEPDLREQLEQVLHEGESLSAFVETSVRESVRRRVNQADFIQRGIASLEAALRSGSYVTADAVVRGLEERLSAARAGKRRKASSARG